MIISENTVSVTGDFQVLKHRNDLQEFWLINIRYLMSPEGTPNSLKVYYINKHQVCEPTPVQLPQQARGPCINYTTKTTSSKAFTQSDAVFSNNYSMSTLGCIQIFYF